SPYSGGAIMGDRIRMSDLASDEGVYIRSMATRGALGGMARATLDSVDILDVAGYRYILIETVGVGQDEVEIASASHTTLVVSALARHKAFLEASDAGRARVRKIAEFRMIKTAEELLRRRFKESSAGRVAAVADRLAAREISPYVAGEQLLDGIGG